MLHQVNILPDGEPEPTPDATFGGATGEPKHLFNFGNDVSADGSHVFWTALKKMSSETYSVKALYVRVNDAQPQSTVEGGHCTEPAKACTILISEGGQYWTATPDGRYVF